MARPSRALARPPQGRPPNEAIGCEASGDAGMDNWFLIYTNERAEAVAADALKAEGFASFAPEYSRAVARSKRIAPAKRGLRSSLTIVRRPLFPRYMFARFDPEAGDLSVVTKTAGVEHVVRGAGVSAMIPERIVSDLCAACCMGLFDELPPPRLARPEIYQQGRAIKMVGGPFADFVGKIKAAPHGQRVLVALASAGFGEIVVNTPVDNLALA